METPDQEWGKKWAELASRNAQEQMKTTLVQREQIKRQGAALEKIANELEQLNKTLKIIAARRS